ncbi:histidine kinase [Persicitalea sp.]|uniref:histidine kinase n=1 Tax=Persicitalea sp. TaxID=3100273 RepID=UPI0035933822
MDQQVVSYHSGRVKEITDNQGWNVTAIIHDEVHLSKTISAGIVQHYALREGKPVPFLRTETDGFVISNALDYPYVFINQETLYYLPAHSTVAERVGESPPGMPPVGFLNQTKSSMLWIPTEKGLWGLMLTGFKNFKDGEVPNPWSVVEDSEGKYLFLNYWKGVQEYDGKNLRFIPQRNYYPKAVASYKPLEISPGPDNWYFRAFRDQDGYCWLPEGTGLYRYKNGAWDFIRKGMNNLAFTIAEDVGRRKVVVASYQHAFTVDIDPPFRTDSIRGKSLLFEGLLLCGVVSPSGKYWFSGRGVERYDSDTKKFTSYTFENKKLPVKSFYMLYFDWNGTLWAGGKEALCRYNPKKDSFEKMFDFKFHQLVQFAEQIDVDRLLIADMKNLYVLNLKKFNATGKVDIKTFNHHNGFMGMEPGQLGSYRDSKGRIWITSGSVLSVLDPTKLDLTTRPLRTFVTSVNKRGVSFTHPDELVEVPEGESIINVKVETLGEDKPYNSQFSYRLEGEMDDWTDWQEQPLITLNNLSNGLHTLRVRSRSGDFNAHGESIATLHFRTKVAIWKSPDFYLYAVIVALALLTALAMLGAISQRRKRKLLQQQNRLEERERSMQLLQAQTIQSQMNPHFTSNVLAAIQNQILNHESERASDNLVKMARLTRAYLDDSLLGQGEQAFRTRDIPLTREIKLLRMYVELMQLQYLDRFDFTLEVPPSLDPEMYKIPQFLIQPFVENAIVHGLHHHQERGHLRVAFRALPDEALLCRIEDDGIGREAVRRIQNQSHKEYASVSTNLSQQRVALLNQLGYDIAIDIEDRKVGTGTVVSTRVGFS